MIIVRDARIEDAAALGALHARTWREAYWGVLPDHMIARETAEGRARWWRSYLARLTSSPRMRDESVAIAVEPDTAAAGFAWSGPARSADAEWDGEIYMLYVLQVAQRRGLGRNLMAAAARRLVSRGFFSLGLWVLDDNGPARAFYEALGGRPAGMRHDHVGGRETPVAGYVWTDPSCLIDVFAAER
jgi:ribosomal protein S18 acetylase RimI-like enzyme